MYLIMVVLIDNMTQQNSVDRNTEKIEMFLLILRKVQKYIIPTDKKYMFT